MISEVNLVSVSSSRGGGQEKSKMALCAPNESGQGRCQRKIGGIVMSLRM